MTTLNSGMQALLIKKDMGSGLSFMHCALLLRIQDSPTVSIKNQ